MPRFLKKDWIIAFSEAMDPISEAPRQYNVWAAISVIGAVLKKKVYFPYGTYTIYPNQYVVLIGPPGVGKGTALHSAYAFPEALKLVNTFEDRLTAEKIVKRLADGNNSTFNLINGVMVGSKDSSTILKIPELSILISASNWMLDLLCACWDQGKFSYDTKNNGTATVDNLCVSLIGGCVPDFIRKVNKDSNITVSSGFSARSIFVYAEEPSKKLAWPKSLDSSPLGQETKKKLLNDLLHISNLSGEMYISPDAEQVFKDWYEGKLVLNAQDSDIIQYFKSRMKVHIIKAAMIFTCSESDSRIISKTDMLKAISAVTSVQKSLDKAFRGVGNSEYAEPMAKIQAFMEKQHAATEKEIFIYVSKDMSYMTMEIALKNLITIGFLRQETRGTTEVFILAKSIKANPIQGVKIP